MPQTVIATKPQPRRSGWSDARRAKHAAAIRIWAPWAKSTGPNTASGKARSALNAYKHGQYALKMRLVSEALRAQSRFLHEFKAYTRLKQQKVGNELLARLYSRLLFLDKTFRVRLYQSLHSPDYAKILLFRRR